MLFERSLFPFKMIQFRNKNPNLPPSPTFSNNNSVNQGRSPLKRPFNDDSEVDGDVSVNSNNTSLLSNSRSKTVIKSLGLNNNPSYSRLNSGAENVNPNNCFTPNMENGGLFNRNECHDLARYISYCDFIGTLFEHMMVIKMEFVIRLKLLNGLLTVTER